MPIPEIKPVQAFKNWFAETIATEDASNLKNAVRKRLASLSPKGEIISDNIRRGFEAIGNKYPDLMAISSILSDSLVTLSPVDQKIVSLFQSHPLILASEAFETTLLKNPERLSNRITFTRAEFELIVAYLEAGLVDPNILTLTNNLLNNLDDLHRIFETKSNKKGERSNYERGFIKLLGKLAIISPSLVAIFLSRPDRNVIRELCRISLYTSETVPLLIQLAKSHPRAVIAMLLTHSVPISNRYPGHYIYFKREFCEGLEIANVIAASHPELIQQNAELTRMLTKKLGIQANLDNHSILHLTSYLKKYKPLVDVLQIDLEKLQNPLGICPGGARLIPPSVIDELDDSMVYSHVFKFLLFLATLTDVEADRTDLDCLTDNLFQIDQKWEYPVLMRLVREINTPIFTSYSKRLSECHDASPETFRSYFMMPVLEALKKMPDEDSKVFELMICEIFSNGLYFFKLGIREIFPLILDWIGEMETLWGEQLAESNPKLAAAIVAKVLIGDEGTPPLDPEIHNKCSPILERLTRDEKGKETVRSFLHLFEDERYPIPNLSTSVFGGQESRHAIEYSS